MNVLRTLFLKSFKFRWTLLAKKANLAMFKPIRSLAIVSRLEFLPAMASWFTIGFSWGIEPPLRFTELVIPATLSFAVIMLSAVVGLQVNTIFDHDLDRLDNRKKGLTQAIDLLGPSRLKLLVAVEFLFGSTSVSLLSLNQEKPALLFMWTAGIFLGYAYSAPPLRLKSRCWLSLGTLLLILCILPVLFMYHTFTSELDPLFLLFLAGQALSVYGLILPTEIRDYFEDGAMGIETTTVRIGLVKASFFSIVFLSTGGMLTGTAFLLKLACGLQPVLTVFLPTIAVADYIVLRKLKKLHSLSREYTFSKNQSSRPQDIRRLAAYSPRWIILASQSAVFMSLILLVGKFLP